MQLWIEKSQKAAQQAYEKACQEIEERIRFKTGNCLYLVFCSKCGHIVTATPAAGNLEEGLMEVRKAVNRLHNLTEDLIQAIIKDAKAQRQTAAIASGLAGLGQMLSE